MLENITITPSATLVNNETEHLLLCFCTYCGLLKGKKLSLQNVFVLILKDRRLRNMLKNLLSIDNNYELFKAFLSFEPSIADSKYITKFLNTQKSIKL